MPVVFPLKNSRGLVHAGVPADPPDDAPETEYALSLQRITNLVSLPELFFSCNPLFAQLRETVDRALHSLLEAGIIGYAGQPLKRKGGCGGCARKKLMSFALQFAARFQTIVLRAQESEEHKCKLETDLRAYLQRKAPGELADGMPIVLYARLKTGEVRKVTL